MSCKKYMQLFYLQHIKFRNSKPWLTFINALVYVISYQSYPACILVCLCRSPVKSHDRGPEFHTAIPVRNVNYQYNSWPLTGILNWILPLLGFVSLFNICLGQTPMTLMWQISPWCGIILSAHLTLKQRSPQPVLPQYRHNNAVGIHRGRYIFSPCWKVPCYLSSQVSTDK